MAARVPLSTVETLMDSAFAVRVIDGAKAGHVSVRAHDGTRLVETTNRS